MSRAPTERRRSTGSDASDEVPQAGLCDRCTYCRIRSSARGGRFYQCLRADDDPHYTRYPRIPVAHCSGFSAAD